MTKTMLLDLEFLCSKMRQGKTAFEQPIKVRRYLRDMEHEGLAMYGSFEGWYLTLRGELASNRIINLSKKG